MPDYYHLYDASDLYLPGKCKALFVDPFAEPAASSSAAAAGDKDEDDDEEPAEADDSPMDCLKCGKTRPAKEFLMCDECDG